MLIGTVINTDSILFQLKEPLKEMIDPDFLLPDELMRREVLTDAARQSVKKKDSLQERNNALLEIVLQKKEKADRHFTDSLQETDQKHVSNFITCDGGNSLLLYVLI